MDSRSVDSIKLIVLRMGYVLADCLAFDVKFQRVGVGDRHHVLPVELDELLLGVRLLSRRMLCIIVVLAVCDLNRRFAQRLGLG